MNNFKQDHSGVQLVKKTGASLGAIALGLGALVLPACQPSNEEIQEDQTNVTTEDVTADTEATEVPPGEEITVRSPVEQEIGAYGFMMESDNGPILVVNATGTPFELPEYDIPVQATGTQETFVLADVETEYDLDLEEDLYVDYENQPAIIAESLALAPTPEDLAAEPSIFYDQVIAIEGEVGEIISPNSFALYEEGWVDDVGLLVTGVEEDLEAEGNPLQEGETVTVTGVARQFDVNVVREEDADIDDQVLSEFEERYTERPVVVADGVYSSAVGEE